MNLHIAMSANEAWNIYNFRRGLVQQFLSHGFKVSILAPKDECSDKLREMGCQIFDIPMSAKGINPIGDGALFLNFLRRYRKLKPDLIINYTIKPNIYGSLAARVALIPSIAVTTGLGYTFINDNLVAKIARQLYKFAFQFPRQIWFLNPDDLEAFTTNRLVDKERTFVLNGEGLNISFFYPQPRQNQDNKFRFLLIARMLWDKGIAEYVSAAKIIKKKYPDAQFQLLGATGAANPSAVSAEQMRAWHEEGLIEYLGTTPDVRPLIAKADCVVLPSYREGVPRTLMEASAMALPIITTNAPGCREVIEDGINGYLCRPRDAVDLAEKMERMITLTSGERVAMGLKGREKVEREFDEKIVIQKYLETIRKIIEGQQPTATDALIPRQCAKSE